MKKIKFSNYRDFLKKLPYEYREYEGEKGRGRGERRGREEE